MREFVSYLIRRGDPGWPDNPTVEVENHSALERGDSEGAVSASHALKGVCGNLSMTRLHQRFTDQVAALRRGDLDGARAMMERIAPAYEAVRSAIGGAADGTR